MTNPAPPRRVGKIACRQTAFSSRSSRESWTIGSDAGFGRSGEKTGILLKVHEGSASRTVMGAAVPSLSWAPGSFRVALARWRGCPCATVARPGGCAATAERLGADVGFAKHAQEMAAQESPRTTTLYDRTKERLTQYEVERIRL